jgi:PAS domain S-box-containing protein
MLMAVPDILLFGIAGYVLAAAGTVTLAGYVFWRHRDGATERAFGVVVGAIALTVIAFTVRLFAADLGAKLRWELVAYGGLVILPAAFLVFALRFTGRAEWVSRPVLAALSVHPVFTLVALATNPGHGLFYEGVGLTQVGDLSLMVWTSANAGPVFWIHLAYSYSLFLLGTVLLLRFALTSNELYKTQMMAIVVGTLVPWVANLAVVSDIGPKYLDPTPLGFALGTIVLGVGVFRFQLLNVVPVARQTLVESLDDAVFVLDSDEQVVETNPAGRTSPCLRPEIDDPVGEPFQSVLRDELAEKPAFTEGTAEWTFRIDEKQRYFWARKTPVTRRGAEGTSLLTVTEVTERRQRERELRETKDRLESFIEASPVAIMAVDSDGDITLWNSAAEEIFGWTEAEVLGDFNPVIPEEKREGHDSLRERAFSGESFSQVELRRRTKDGTQVDVTLSTAPLYDADGELIEVVAFLEDITDRKQRERELERTKDLLEKAQETASIGGWEVDFERGTQRWTDEVYRIHGLPLGADVPIEDGIEFYHPEDREKITTAFDSLRTEGESYDLELRIVTAAEEVQWVRTIGDPLFGEDGSVVGARGIFQDITERKQNEQDLRELTERLDLAVEGANLGVWDWNMETDAVTFNEQWAEMLGLSLEEIEPRLETWEERVHPEDMPRVERQLNAHIQGESERYDCEHRMQTGDGDWKWVRDVGEIVERDDDGDPTRAVGIHIDVTERRETQKTLEEERDTFAQGPAVVFKWENAQGWPVEYVSDNVTETFGYTPTQLQSGEVPYLSLIHDDDFDRVGTEVENHSEEGVERFSHEPYRIVTEAGDVRWVLDNTKIVRDDGEITHYLGYLIDITERKRLEDSLRESEESLRELYRITSDTDLPFEEKLVRILELARDRLDLPFAFLTRIDDDTQHTVEAVGSHDRLQAGASGPLSEAYCRKTIQQTGLLGVQDAADEGWASDPAYERFDLGCYLGGKVIVNESLYGTLCVAGDAAREHSFTESEEAFVELLVQWVSYELERDRLEGKLRDLQEVSGKLMEAGSIDEVGDIAVDSAEEILGLDITGIWTYDEEQGVLLPVTETAGARELFGSSPRFEPGNSLTWEVFERGEMAVFEDISTVEGRYREDTEIRAEIILPLGDQGVISTGSTSEQEFSDTDIGLFELFASTVSSAMLRAEREQSLRETRAELERSNENLEQFAYAASHDLQEPLRTISNYLQLLERRYEDDLDGDAKEFIEFAVNGAERMHEMIRGILKYSRVDTQGEPLGPTDLNSVYELACRNLKIAIEESDATITADELPTVRGDESQLVQLLQNLLDNAIKYTGDTQPRVHVSADRTDGRWVIAVEDNGIGMSPEATERVFRIFERLHGRKSYSGTGIGLAMCRKIVDRHDGDIWVDSEEGEGTTFYVALPAVNND